MNFKNDLPENCPDRDIKSIEEDRLFYRVSKNTPPTEDDFIPLWFSRKMASDKECMAKGISVSEDIDDAKRLIKMFKNMGKYIYGGIIIYKKDGIVSLTPNYKNPSHRTWYPYHDTNEINIFKIKEV